MTTCVPITDLRNTASFLELVESSKTPITVTKNGYDKFVVIKSQDFQNIQEQAALSQLFARMLLAEEERSSNKYVDGAEAVAMLRQKYEI